LKRRSSGLLGERTKEAQEGRGREAGSTVLQGTALERRKTQESIGPPDLRVRIGIRILARRNALESRGIVNFWFSEQEYAMPETTRGHRRRKAYGSVGGKSSEG
jgi:hypothetical protein